MVGSHTTTAGDWCKVKDASCVRTAFSCIAESSTEPTLWPIETLPRQLHTMPDPPEVIGEKELLWVRQAWSRPELMNDEASGVHFRLSMTLSGHTHLAVRS